MLLGVEWGFCGSATRKAFDIVRIPGLSIVKLFRKGYRMDTIRVSVRVTGLVQGVWYRGSARSRASDLGLTGWVRNEVDGSVALEAEGPEDRVDRLIQWCGKGPPAARVRDVRVTRVAPTGSESSFEIRYY
jgi:acylphosphatase